MGRWEQAGVAGVGPEAALRGQRLAAVPGVRVQRRGRPAGAGVGRAGEHDGAGAATAVKVCDELPGGGVVAGELEAAHEVSAGDPFRVSAGRGVVEVCGHPGAAAARAAVGEGERPLARRSGSVLRARLPVAAAAKVVEERHNVAVGELRSAAALGSWAHGGQELLPGHMVAGDGVAHQSS